MANLVASPSSRRPPSSTSAVFSLPSSDSSDAGDDNTPLPFPAALPRSDFLVRGFQPVAYLSALPHRHQTLEDLRSDLRERSAAISAELLELVNSNYTAFLSLGNELRGGDDKVEDVKVSLLGFRRAVDEVKGKVSKRQDETQTLNDELHDVRSSIEQGRNMIEISERLSSLEERLALESMPAGNGGVDWDLDESDVDDEEEDEAHGRLGNAPTKLAASAREWSGITTMTADLDQNHPFVIRLEERLTRSRNTLLLDLGHALKEARAAGGQGQDNVMLYLGIYRTLDAQDEAVRVLRGH